VLFFVRRQEARGWAERFAVVEERQITHVERQRAAWSLLVDHDRDRAALHAFAETNPAPASQACVREPLQHRSSIILQERLERLLEVLFARGSPLFRADRTISCDQIRGWKPEERTASVKQSVGSP